jgi:hypothetical protein
MEMFLALSFRWFALQRGRLSEDGEKEKVNSFGHNFFRCLIWTHQFIRSFISR